MKGGENSTEKNSIRPYLLSFTFVQLALICSFGAVFYVQFLDVTRLRGRVDKLETLCNFAIHNRHERAKVRILSFDFRNESVHSLNSEFLPLKNTGCQTVVLTF